MEHNWPTERLDAPAQSQVHATFFRPLRPCCSSIWVFRCRFSHLERMPRKPGGPVASLNEAPYVPATRNTKSGEFAERAGGEGFSLQRSTTTSWLWLTRLHHAVPR